MTPDEVKRLADDYAHCYSFVGDDTMPRRKAELYAAIDAIAAQAVPAQPVALPPEYMLAKLAMVMPLFQEARDALCAITEVQRKMHGISLTLADRMDYAGTYSLDDWHASPQAAQPGQLVSVSSIDVERMLAECVPGGSSCDPQQVADAIRHYCNAQPSEPAKSKE